MVRGTSTKMKGLRKGFKYFSHIFEDEKEPEIQIGFPTDVKHVAHIGWDGPSSVESPSWMKDFNGTGGFQSAPLGPTRSPMENPEVKWVSEDSKGSRRRDLPELPKSSRRPSSTENSLSAESPRRESSSKTRHSRKHQSKDSSDSIKGSLESEPSSRNLPDIPKKSRRKKSRDSIGNVGSSSRSKANASSKSNDDLSQTNNMDSPVQEEEKGTSGIS